MIVLNDPQFLFSVDRANALAAQLNAEAVESGDGWKYEVESYENGLARVLVYDEDGELVESM